MSQVQEGVCIALIAVILSICYFSPNYRDYFENMMNDANTWVPLIPPGPGKELNVQSLQAGFPYYSKEQIKLSQENGTRDATIRNYDGSIANGYQPSIIRPPDSTAEKRKTVNGEPCSWPCYSGSKHEHWCDERNAIDYYAMRPLVTPRNYNGWLTNLFNQIVVPGDSVSKILDSKLSPKMFCDDGTLFNGENKKKEVMNWLMRRIADTVPKIPQMTKNSSWKNEEFHYTDDEMYAFTTDNGKGSVYKIIFNLYNPLRSTSTLVESVIISPDDKGYILAKMDFVNKGDWDASNPNLPDAMRGYNLPKPNGDLVMDIDNPALPNSTLMNWNYGNTLNQQEFNEFGFYQNGKNIKINGGVPESLKAAIASQEASPQKGFLLECGVMDYTGVQNGNPVVPQQEKGHGGASSARYPSARAQGRSRRSKKKYNKRRKSKKRSKK